MEEAFFEATTPSKKFTLAKTLIAQGEATDSSARRFVMWREARDLAADAGQPSVMIEAVDHLAGRYQVDALDMKADTLANFPPKNTVTALAFREAALKLIDEALAAHRHSVAAQFALIAVEAAKSTNNAELVKRTQQRAKEIQDQSAAPGS